MAHDVKITNFMVQPVENDDGTLKAVTIQKRLRTQRRSDDGRQLNYGQTDDVGEPLEIPVDKLSDLIRELADWPIWYAKGKDGDN